MKFGFIVFFASVFVACNNSNETIKPVHKNIDEWVFAPGQMEWDNSYYLTAQSDGVLKNANFEIGNLVRKGDVIAIVDNANNLINANASNDQLKIAKENIQSNAPAIEQLKQNIRFAEAKYQQDKLVAERYQRLYESESTSKIEMENKLLASENSLANLNSLKKQLEIINQQARQQYILSLNQKNNYEIFKNYNSIKVVQSGIVIKKYKSTGDFVRKGDLIASIADSSKIEIVLNVDESSIGKVKIGQMVTVQLNTNKTMYYKGKIFEIQPSFDVSSQSYVCKVILEDKIPFALNIFGTPLEANILIGSKNNVLVIPRKYLSYGNKVKLKGKKELVEIKVGIMSTEYVEVIEGLSVDDVLMSLKP